MLLNLKIVIDKQNQIKKLESFIKEIIQYNKKNKRQIDDTQQATINQHRIISKKIKNLKIEQILFDIYANCPTLQAIIPKEFKDKNILFDFEQDIVHLDTGEIICEFASKKVLENSLCVYEEKEDIWDNTTYFVVSGDYIDSVLNYDESVLSPLSLPKYYNNYYDFHIKITNIENTYSDINDYFNIYLTASFYSGWVKRDALDHVEGEFITEFNEDINLQQFTLTPSNIHEHSDFDSALLFLYKNDIYSTNQISSFKCFKQHLKAIKKYTNAVKKIFTLYNDNLEQRNEPSCFMSFIPVHEENGQIKDYQFILSVKHFIDNEDISIPVTPLDIAYCNIDKVLEEYYRVNRKIHSILDKETFLEHTKESLEVIYMSYY